jgi:SAM-dependent methyltransferase
VTGLDFSQPALEVAASVAAQLCIGSARFVLADVYDAPTVLAGQTFDIVYTSIGSLQYLPDIERWARIVAALVAPGGFCYLTETRPLIRFIGKDCRSLEGDYFSRRRSAGGVPPRTRLDLVPASSGPDPA